MLNLNLYYWDWFLSHCKPRPNQLPIVKAARAPRLVIKSSLICTEMRQQLDFIVSIAARRGENFYWYTVNDKTWPIPNLKWLNEGGGTLTSGSAASTAGWECRGCGRRRPWRWPACPAPSPTRCKSPTDGPSGNLSRRPARRAHRTWKNTSHLIQAFLSSITKDMHTYN